MTCIMTVDEIDGYISSVDIKQMFYAKYSEKIYTERTRAYAKQMVQVFLDNKRTRNTIKAFYTPVLEKSYIAVLAEGDYQKAVESGATEEEIQFLSAWRLDTKVALYEVVKKWRKKVQDLVGYGDRRDLFLEQQATLLAIEEELELFCDKESCKFFI